MSLKAYIEERKKIRKPLVMTHVVCGYPSFEDNMKELEIMAAHGVDFVELQFPFSEPSADGPLFVKANQESVQRGTTVAQCFEFMAEVSQRFDFKVLMMGYYNTCFKMGHENFVKRLKEAGACGYILPDLPIEEAGELHALSKAAGLAPVILMTPTNSDERLAKLGVASEGLVYCVARKGVTGSKTQMSQDVVTFLDRCRKATDVALGVGFGVSSKDDIDFIREHGDIAIIGTAALKAWEAGREEALNAFFNSLGL
ncbi:MAG: tryptophan synthase subunit alpha [Pseudomonadales bacterium]|jgi:tryptophan synthase alpha chain